MTIQLPAKAIKELKELKALNCHTEGYALAAKLLGHAELTTTFERLLADQMVLGEITMQAYHDRHVAYDQLMAYAKANMTPADYNRFYMCF